MDFEKQVAEKKMEEIKNELKTVQVNERIAQVKLNEYEEYLNTRTSLNNTEKTVYISKLQSEINNIK